MKPGSDPPCAASPPPVPSDARRQAAEIAELAGGLAHEIKNPLSTIGLNLELLAEELETPETPRERRMLQRIEAVQRECGHLGAILDAFLQFARAGEPEFETADLNAAVREFLDFFRPTAAEARVDLSPHLAAGLPAVRLDRRLFRQALLNLALNAVQAMPDGGPLEFQTALAAGPATSADPSGPASAVELRVIDCGRGMDAATLPRIWRAFFSKRPGGNGLGLPTVRKIVEAHAGQIACESEPGQGTRFTITLPAGR